MTNLTSINGLTAVVVPPLPSGTRQLDTLMTGRIPADIRVGDRISGSRLWYVRDVQEDGQVRLDAWGDVQTWTRIGESTRSL